MGDASNAWADIDIVKRRIEGSRSNGRDVVLVEHAVMERLIDALERIAMHTSGGLTYLGAPAKHAQLIDIAKRCEEAGFTVPARGNVV